MGPKKQGFCSKINCIQMKLQKLILIILGSEVSVQMEQDEQENEILPASTSDKDASFVLEPGK